MPWSVNGVKAVEATSLTLAVEIASSVEPVIVSKSVVRIVVTLKSRAIRLIRGERNMLRSLMNEKPTFIHREVNYSDELT